jgi:hypothetical protein
MATGVELTETERMVSGIALSFPANDDTALYSSSSKSPKVPRRLRRLLEPRIPSTAEEIEAKLRGAHLRRQVSLSLSLNVDLELSLTLLLNSSVSLLFYNLHIFFC